MSRVKPIVVVCGIPGSGKSTVGSALTTALPMRSKFWPEIGREAHERTPGVPWNRSISFDRSVMREELQRDPVLQASRSLPVVETWHPGNLAIVAVRCPSLLPSYARAFERTLRSIVPFVVLLDLAPSVARKRAGYAPMAEALMFLREVRASLRWVVREFDLRSTTISAGLPPNRVLAQSVRSIDGWGAESLANPAPPRTRKFA